MVVVMKEGASDPQVEAVIAHLVELGMDVHRSTGASRIVLGVVGGGTVDPRLIELMDGARPLVESDNKEIVSALQSSTSTVYRTRRRFVEGGLEFALEEARREGGRPKGGRGSPPP